MTYRNYRSRDFERRAAAADKSRRARTLEKKGITDAMWDMLQTLHLARLKPERGYRAASGQTTLVALHARGLATWEPIDGDGVGVMWKATEEGAAMMKAGRPE